MEVICDLAETYHVLNYRALPIDTLAALVVGLRDNSRIKLKIAGAKISLQDMLLAMCVDKLSLLVYSKTKDAESGKNQPQSIVELLLEDDKESEFMVFDTIEDFDSYRAQFFKGE